MGKEHPNGRSAPGARPWLRGTAAGPALRRDTAPAAPGEQPGPAAANGYGRSSGKTTAKRREPRLPSRCPRRPEERRSPGPR